MDNYYQILGVPQNASADEIRRAYHTQAKKYHPDTGGSEEMFKRIGTAYSVLSDPKKRADYDLTLKQQTEQARRQRTTQRTASSGYSSGGSEAPGSSSRSAASGHNSDRRSGTAGGGSRSGTGGDRSARRPGTDQKAYGRKARQEDHDSMDSAWDLWHEIFGEFEEDVWSAFTGTPFGRSSGYSRRRQGENLYDEDFQDEDGFQYDDPFQAYREDRRRTSSRSGSWSSQTGSRKRKTAAGARAPQDLRATVKITASEARDGCSKKIHVHYKDMENGNVYNKFRVDKSYLAEIPAGAYDGMKIRLQGAGKPPEAGGSGNVIVTVKVVVR